MSLETRYADAVDSLKSSLRACINCGQEASDLKPAGIGDFQICPACIKAGEEMEAMLDKGIEIGYADGSTETFRSDH